MTARYLRLADVCEINPRLPRTHGLVDDDEVSFVPMAAVDEVSGAIKSSEVRRYAEVKKGYTSFAAGDVLFAKITPCMENGKAALVGDLVGGRGFGSTEFHVLRAGDHVMPEWLRYFVRREAFRHEAKRNFTGTAGQQRVPASFLKNALIPVPSRGEQQRIVDQLSRAEAIVRLRRQAQQKAAELIPAIFADMFGDPATNPKGLAVVTLGDVLASADYGSSSKASDTDAGLPMIRMGNVDYSGNVDLSELKYVDLAPDEVVRFGLKDGDILFNRTNSKELVGKTGLWIGDREAILASYFIRLRVSEQRARPFFVWAFMNSPHMKRVLFETARGAIGQANINSRELRAFQILLPDLDEQARFESRCRDVLALQAQQRHALAKAEAAFQALLARAFSASSQQAPNRKDAPT
jgi:type I restriction enzyme S subunit